MRQSALKGSLLLIAWVLLAGSILRAQEIDGLEYYFNNDPGVGQATFVDLTNAAQIDESLNIPLDGLDFGLHTLYIRVADTAGNWSLSSSKQFLLFDGNSSASLDGLEYFINEDPGVGQAIYVDLDDSPVLNRAVTLDLSMFEPGFHVLYIRVKDTNGSYSLAMARPVFIADGADNTPTLARLEYFFDEDPGYGNGRHVSMNDGGEFDGNLELSFDGIEPGLHQLYIRVQDNFGAWSHTQQHSLVVFPGTGMDLNLTRIEYYFDEDPGFGNGYQVDVEGSLVDSQVVFLVPEDLSLGQHKLYVRALDEQGRWSHIYQHDIFACPGGPAIAGFRPVRYGNTISFVDTSSNGLTFFWDFGDGATSNLANPMHTFDFGVFTITQIVENGCNSDTATFTLEIEGVESYTPDRAGLGGDLAMIVYGGGFDEATTLRLVSGGQEVVPTEWEALSFTELHAFFDFHLVDVGGYYDLEITIDGLAPIVIPDAVFLEEAAYPHCFATIEGPDTWRRGRFTQFELVVENTGNLNARGVPVFLAVPDDVDVEILAEREYFRFDTINPFLYYDTVTQQLYDIEYSEVRDVIHGMRYDYLEVDSLNGRPFEGRIYDILVPNIPARSTVSYVFRARANSTGRVEMSAFAGTLNLFGSPAAPQWLDMTENVGTMALDQAYNMADESNNKWLTALLGTAKAGREHMKLAARYYGMRSGGVSSGEAFASVYGGGQLDAANAYALKTAGEVVADQGLGQLSDISASNIEGLKGRSKFMAERILKTDDVGLRNMRQRIQERILDQIKQETTESGRREFLWDVYSKINDVADSKEYLENTLKFLDGCPELDQIKDDILDEIDKVLGQENEDRKPTDVINSTDPNAIYGPGGYNPDFIRKGRNAHFTVAFENVDTASAPAQIVEIYDTLDLSVFDPATFSLGHFTVAGELIRVPADRKQYVTEYDMRPAKDVLLRINATFDDSTGVIYWNFMSLDPVSGQLVSDPFEGFLNPNVNSPEGEGLVAYDVRLRGDLMHGTSYTNRASIVFDDNEAIVTNTWTNTIDDTPPSTTLSSAYRIVNDSTLRLGFDGGDAGSGIRFYEVYVSEDNSEFLAYAVSKGDSLDVGIREAQTLYLYCVGVDSTGNRESKTTADIVVTLSPTLVVNELNDGESVKLYPNPNSGTFYLDVVLEAAEALQVRLFDLRGSEVFRQSKPYAGGHQVIEVHARLPAGFYHAVVSTVSGRPLATAKMVIR